MFSAHSENESATESPGEPPSGGFNKKIIFLAFASIGVVFGDIGTSPLYAIKACFYGQHAIGPGATNILGVLSLIFWSMFVVVSVKYVTFILRADNRGEGGIFALVSLLKASDEKLFSLCSVRSCACRDSGRRAFVRGWRHYAGHIGSFRH